MLLALDQSSHISGYAIFNDNKQLITYGKFAFDDKDIGIRLMKIRNKIEELIKNNNITEVVMEDIQLQNNVVNNVKTFKILAEVFGVIYEFLTELNMPNEAILAASWKSGLNIKGKARAEQKKNAQLFVQSTYNIKPTQDECDAICIGYYYLNRNKSEETFDWAF